MDKPCTSSHTLFVRSSRAMVKKEIKPFIVLTWWGPTRKIPSRLQAQHVPCYHLCLAARLILRTCRTWSTSHCSWTEPHCMLVYVSRHILTLPVKGVFSSVSQRDLLGTRPESALQPARLPGRTLFPRGRVDLCAALNIS